MSNLEFNQLKLVFIVYLSKKIRSLIKMQCKIKQKIQNT